MPIASFNSPVISQRKDGNLIFEVLNRTQKSAITLEPHIRSVSKNFGIILAGGSLDGPKMVAIGVAVFSKNREPKSHWFRDTNIAEFYSITRAPATRWIANVVVELSAKQEVHSFHIPVEKKAEHFM